VKGVFNFVHAALFALAKNFFSNFGGNHNCKNRFVWRDIAGANTEARALLSGRMQPVAVTIRSCADFVGNSGEILGHPVDIGATQKC
jgi:hypothetical protein